MLTLLISRYPSTFLVDSTTIADVENQQASHPPNTQESEKPGSCDVKSGHFSFAEVNNPPISNAQFFPETDLSQGIVGRDGLDDPANLQNFSSARQWGLLALISLIDSRISPRVEHVRSRGGLRGEDLHGNDSTLLSFSVCIFPFGPLILAPMSALYGRRIVLSFANWFFVVWQIRCALAPNIATLIVFRVLARIGGSGCLTLGQVSLWISSQLPSVARRPLFGP
ncbi:hypothetical protein EYZ11_012115 [Aspergillus tanneri]|uniref:Major facilitator superfamily (MFS) profile domain-containing protein n=1 Tax=Aspergillus tanneri TaxID=1220188 RepID=A0A4S3J121_9EURO|nr:hypothetical protein EYZ11_012115 [Aspergillus tanneri]